MSGGKDGSSPTSAKFLSGMLGSLPPMDEMFKMAGMELPGYLKGTKAPADVEPILLDEHKTSNDENA